VFRKKRMGLGAISQNILFHLEIECTLAEFEFDETPYWLLKV
jgi:hypothetical protein